MNGLIAGLQAEIERLPVERAGEAEAVTTRLAKMTKALADGNGELATIGGGALERAADALADAETGHPGYCSSDLGRRPSNGRIMEERETTDFTD